MLTDKLIWDTCRESMRNMTPEDTGFVRGKTGLLLADAYSYLLYEEEQYQEECYLLLQALLEKHYGNFSFGYGLAGIAWTVRLLDQMDLLEDVREWQQQADRILLKITGEMIEKGITNYFYGASGILNYLLEGEITTEVKEVCRQYMQLIAKESGTLSFLLFDPHLRKDGIKRLNLGMPHGVSGIIAMLLKISEKTGLDMQELTDRMIARLMINGQREKAYVFPTYELEGARSALAWCYGDLPVCCLLAKYRKVFRSEKYRQLEEELSRQLLFREDYFPGNVAICHGIMSVAYLFYKLGEIKEEESYMERSFYWCQKAEAVITEMFGQYRQHQKYKLFFENPSLLNGVAGYWVAKATIKGDIDKKWDSCLLL